MRALVVSGGASVKILLFPLIHFRMYYNKLGLVGVIVEAVYPHIE